MLIGTMNHPSHDILREIEWMAAMGFGFVDLTLEPPGAASWRVNAREIRRALADHGLAVVGHTAWYLPIAAAIEELRTATVDELKRCMDVFHELGAEWMNVHPDRNVPWHDRRYLVQRNLESLQELAAHGAVGVMVENVPGEFNSAAQLGELLDPMPALGLHLDIGHANLQVPRNTTVEILERYGSRLRHVHLHDNKGGHADLHLPLGTGTVELRASIGALVECGYNETITLEVFTPDKRHLEYSRDVLRALWDSIVEERSRASSLRTEEAGSRR
jgi:sugar phosphate isomerase/epimerase